MLLDIARGRTQVLMLSLKRWLLSLCLPTPQLAASTHKHAEAALEESRQRAAREQRMDRLKVTFGVALALQYACHASERGAPAMAAIA